MINKYAEITGLSETDFNKLKTEFGLTDELMQTILDEKMKCHIEFNLITRCAWYCLVKEFGELDAKFIFYTCKWKDTTMFHERPNTEELLKGYERYRHFFENS